MIFDEVLSGLRFPFGRAFACVLGGDDGRELFVCTYSESGSMDPAGPPVGRIVAARVEVPSAGSP